MIVEELIALIGFKVDNEEDIARATTWFERMKLRVLEFARAVQTKLRAAMSKLGDFGRRAGGAIARGVAALAGGIARLGVVLAVGAAAFAGIGLAAAGILGVFTTVAAAIASVGGKLAQARRELQLMAIVSGTSARKVDAIGNVFAALGGSDIETGRKRAEEFLKDVAELRDDALRGDKEARKKLAAAKISASETNGTPRDTSNLATDIIQRRYEMTKKRDAATTPGARKLTDQAVRQFDEKFGTGKIVGALLDAAGSYEEYRRLSDESNARNPTQSTEQEERSRRVAEEFNKLQASASALSSMFGNLAKKISDNLLPTINKIVDWLVGVMKQYGFINETQGEIDERRRVAKERVDIAQKRLDAVDKPIPGESPWDRDARERRDSVGRLRSELVEAKKAYDAAMKADVPLPPDRLDQAMPLPKGRPGTAPSAVPLPPVRPVLEGGTFGDWLKSLSSDATGAIETLFQAATARPALEQAVSPEGAAERTARTVEQNTATTNYNNVGNDQKTINNSVTINVEGQDALVGAVQEGISSALVKSSNATTATVPGP